MNNQESILSVKGLGIDFGGLTAVNKFNIEVGKTDIYGLIGPNGAGKTTVFNMLTKVYTPSRGTIVFDGKDTAKMNSIDVNKAGIARTFQNIRLFANQSVLDNVLVGMHNTYSYNVFDAIVRSPRFKKEEKANRQRAMELLEIFDLADSASVPAKSLPYGAQRRLEIARALASEPKLLLLDEPAAGMNPVETEELMNTIRFIRDKFQIAILLIEHDMKLVMGVCEKITVLNFGQVLVTGTPEEVQNNPEVIKAYIGD